MKLHVRGDECIWGETPLFPVQRLHDGALVEAAAAETDTSGQVGGAGAGSTGLQYDAGHGETLQTADGHTLEDHGVGRAEATGYAGVRVARGFQRIKPVLALAVEVAVVRPIPTGHRCKQGDTKRLQIASYFVFPGRPTLPPSVGTVVNPQEKNRVQLF